MSTTIKETFMIKNEFGLHARAAAAFVKIANRFSSSIVLQRGKIRVNGKSIMGVLMLMAPKGTQVTLEAEGPDAKQAISELGELIKNKFGE